jgi:lipoprotein-anchoring transpeptidase ErfK/SrfK
MHFALSAHMKALLATTVLLLSGTLFAQTATPPKGGTATAKATAPVVSEVVATQVMLDRAGFSSGEIDGRMGVNVRRALNAFQAVSGRPAAPTMDGDTWQQLRERAGDVPPLVSYTLTDADVAGPFTPVPKDLMEQSKLESLGYQSALEAIAEKFHASPQLLRDLNPGVTFERAGETVMVPNVEVIAPPEPEGRSAAAPPQARGRGAASAPPNNVTIFVTKSTSALTVEENGRVIFHAPVTSGSEHDPLPIGKWKVNGVQKNPPFHYNPDLFWDADPGHSKATIKPGPNNPVGVAWIDISKPHYGIHGTPEPSNIGHVQSHGCVRLTNWDVQRVAQWARAGTPVVFRE